MHIIPLEKQNNETFLFICSVIHLGTKNQQKIILSLFVVSFIYVHTHNYRRWMILKDIRNESKSHLGQCVIHHIHKEIYKIKIRENTSYIWITNNIFEETNLNRKVYGANQHQAGWSREEEWFWRRSRRTHLYPPILPSLYIKTYILQGKYISKYRMRGWIWFIARIIWFTRPSPV